MPKSRKRRKTKKPSPSRSWAAQQAHLPVVLAADEAEARGDAAAALALIQEDVAQHGVEECFWRPERVTRLLQLELVGALLPRWATSRWVLDQAAQWLDPRGRRRTLRALEIAERAGGMRDFLQDVDPLDARVKLMDHDWVHRQALLYDLGGLREFLARGGTADLIAGADRIHDWAATPMGVYRLVRDEGTTSAWVDLASGEERSCLEIGAAVHVDDGEHVLGRLVPIDGGLMFESAPLTVPDDVADRVAEEPAQWISALTDRCEEDRRGSEQIFTYRDAFPLLDDVPLITKQICAVCVAEEETGGDSLAGEPDPVELGLQVVRAALDDHLPTHPIWRRPGAIVGATLLQPSVFLRIGHVLERGDHAKLHGLADRLPEPAAAVCRELAFASERAA